MRKPIGRPTAKLLVATAILSALGGSGCVAPPLLGVRAERYRIDVRLDPASHQLVGRTVIDLARTDDVALPKGKPVALELQLHPDLKITRVAASGAEVKRTYKRRVRASHGELAYCSHMIILDEPADALTLFLEYKGKLFQDVAAGEKPGEIHNLAMRAHIGEDGIYLGGGHWYPQPAPGPDAATPLADFVLVAEPVDGFELAAAAQSDPDLAAQTGKLAWSSTYPIDGMVLLGGAHEVHRDTQHGVAITLHLKPEQAEHAQGLFEAVGRYLDRYEPLIGPYPADEFTIVDNFFSSGFAFPMLTLLSSSVINMGQRSQTAHGYIDHEMLHCWWGNGVHVDPRDGNWCEALASYGANYYGHVLDGNGEDARRTRRNYSHFLSRLKPENDKPLGTYGQKGGCGRRIAYSKGAIFFHMLARKIGQDRFWAAMRRFTDEYLGKRASWNDIRRLCQEEGGQDLTTFFEQWMRRSGAPALKIDHARYISREGNAGPDSSLFVLKVALSQGEPEGVGQAFQPVVRPTFQPVVRPTGKSVPHVASAPRGGRIFELDVPLRITHRGGFIDVDVPLREASQEVEIPVDVVPLTVELDPDYHIFRKIPLGDAIPTTAATRHGTAFASVVGAGEVAEQYISARSIFESSFDEDERIALIAGEIEEGALAGRCTLILGEAVHDPLIAAFLDEIEFPVHFTEEGFEFNGVAYSDPADGLLCTVSHPGVEGGGVTVVFAVSESAMPRATFIPYYDRSLVIFKDRAPVLRHDFERHQIVQVETVGD